MTTFYQLVCDFGFAFFCVGLVLWWAADMVAGVQVVERLRSYASTVESVEMPRRVYRPWYAMLSAIVLSLLGAGSCGVSCTSNAACERIDSDCKH